MARYKPEDHEAVTGFDKEVTVKDVMEPELPDADDFDEEGEGALPNVNGHQIKPREFHAFKAYVACNGVMTHTEDLSGVSRAQLYRWKEKDWWKYLEDRYFGEAQRTTKLLLATRMKEAANTLYYVMDGISPDDKTAGAKVNAARIVFEAGNDPIVKKSPALQLNQNTINNYGNISIEKLKQLPSDKLHEMASTFEITDDVVDV